MAAAPVRVPLSPLPPRATILFAQALTPFHAQALFVFIKRVVSGAVFYEEDFAEIELCEGDTAARITKRACKEFPHWGVSAGQVRLYRVPGGRDEARVIQRSQTAILRGEPLFADDPVVPGSWLLARMPPSAAVGTGASLAATARVRASAAGLAQRGDPLLSPADFGRLAWESLSAAHARLRPPLFCMGGGVRPGAAAVETAVLPDRGDAVRDARCGHCGRPDTEACAGNVGFRCAVHVGGGRVHDSSAVTPHAHKKVN